MLAFTGVPTLSSWPKGKLREAEGQLDGQLSIKSFPFP